MRIAPPSSPGAPDCVVTVTPGAMPCRAAEVETIGRLSNAFESMVATEPVTLTFFWVP